MKNGKKDLLYMESETQSCKKWIEKDITRNVWWIFVPIYRIKKSFVDVVGVCPNILHEAGLQSNKEALDRKRVKKIATEDLVKIAEFVLKNNYFKFDRSVYQ